MTTTIALALGLSLLFLGGHYLISHAGLLAARLNMNPFVIGLTIVAFGTSAPELVVSLDAVLTGHDDIVMGNIIGGNLANILLVLSISALICPIPIHATIIRREGITLIIATLLFMGLCLDAELTFADGVILLSGFLAFNVYSLLRPSRTENDLNETPLRTADRPAKPPTSLSSHALWIIGALIALAVGSHLFVEGAVQLSRLLGVSEAVIGLTVVAVGTAAPEIVTAAIAAWQRQSTIAMGNVLGSNIFNMLGIGGVTTLVSPVAVHPHFIDVDFAVLLIATAGIVLYGHLRPVLGRAIGIMLFAAYAGYVISLF